jgi:folate-binding protein YgfZ
MTADIQNNPLEVWERLRKKLEPMRENKLEVSNSNSLIPLESYRAVLFEGPDAASFLQNQVTSDVGDLKHGFAYRSGYCNPKGRLIATLWLIKSEENIVALLPYTVLMDFVQRIKRFIMRSQVTISELPDAFVMGLIKQGEDSPPVGRCEAVINDSMSFVLVDTKDPSDEVQVLIRSTRLDDENRWFCETIKAGFIDIEGETQEQFLPQWINLQANGGVSFSKGCYPGQEIVARTKYLGEVKRRLFRLNWGAQVDSPKPIVNKDGQTAGTLLSCAQMASGEFIGLGVIKIDHINAGENLFLDDVSISRVESVG